MFNTRNEMLKYYSDELVNPKILEIGVFRGEFLDYIVNPPNDKLSSPEATTNHVALSTPFLSVLLSGPDTQFRHSYCPFLGGPLTSAT